MVLVVRGMARAMVVSGLVLLVSVVCVASAPMDFETKVRSPRRRRSTVFPPTSSASSPSLRSLLTPPLPVTLPVSSPALDLQLASVASDAALPARWSGALKNTLAFARNNGNAATVLRQLRAMEKRVAAKKVRSRMVPRVLRMVGERAGQVYSTYVAFRKHCFSPSTPGWSRAGLRIGCRSRRCRSPSADLVPPRRTCGVVWGRIAAAWHRPGFFEEGLAGPTMACY